MAQKIDEELKKIEKLGWFLSGAVKIRVFFGIFILFGVFGIMVFNSLNKVMLFEHALLIGFFLFTFSSFGLMYIINKKKLIEKLIGDKP